MNTLCAAQLRMDPHHEAKLISDLYIGKRRSMNRRDPSLLAAFLRRIAWGATDCWYWVGSVNDTGYGMFAGARGHSCQEIVAHRIAWHLWYGPIPNGLLVLHRCDVRACVNPEHLFLGNQADNVADMVSKGRHKNVPMHGSSNGMARLEEPTVAAVRIDYSNGASQHSLARKYSVSPMTINRIVRNKSWRTM